MQVRSSVITISVVIMAVVACSRDQLPQTGTNEPPLTMETSNYDSLWVKADSLSEIQQYRSAREVVLQIEEYADSKGDKVQWLKAQLYLASYAFVLSEDESLAAIESIEEALLNTTYPTETAVLKSAAAELYTHYFQSNVSRITERSQASEPDTGDIATWNGRMLIDKIGTYYFESLDSEELLEVPVEEYHPILTPSNTDELRPGLFDVLAYRAISFFGTDVWFLTEFDIYGEFSSEQFMLPADEFVTINIDTSDGSFRKRALLVYQRLIAQHLSGENISALVHTDLARLNFVMRHLSHDNIDEMYLGALTELRQEVSGQTAEAEVLHALATHFYQRASSLTSGNALIDAAGLCRQGIDIGGTSIGAQKCTQLLDQILRKEISMQSERVWYPGENMLASISYRNTSKAFVRIFPIENERIRDISRRDREELQDILNGTSIAQYSFDLPAAEDHYSHSTEVYMEGLPVGDYMVFVSDDADFGETSNTHSILLTVSSIAFWQEVVPSQAVSTYEIGDYKPAEYVRFIVVDRKTGKPLEGAMVELYGQVYLQDLRRNELVYLSKQFVEASGVADEFNTKGSRALVPKITYKDEVLFVPDGFFNAQRPPRPAQPSRSMTLFTDRSVYRPGQLIHFKGYAIEKKSGELPLVISQQGVSITLRDVNGRPIDTLNLETSQFGTVSGTFRAPEEGLTGRFRIVSSMRGSTTLRVEEYKRPTFEISLDSLNDVARLGDTVVLEGNATTYAGIGVGNAEVKYRVYRRLFLPWWARSGNRILPPYARVRQLIYSGETTANSLGDFSVKFHATPVEGFEDIASQFEVEVDVTDVAGEQQSTSERMYLNTYGFELKSNLSQGTSLEELRNVQFGIRSLDGKPLAGEIEIETHQLEYPIGVFRSRYWPAPDQVVLTGDEYAEYLPSYLSPVYSRTDDLAVVQSMAIPEVAVDGEIDIDLSQSISVPGAYKVVIVAKSGGATLTREFTIKVDDRESGTSVGGNPVKVAQLPERIEVGNDIQLGLWSSTPELYLRYRQAYSFEENSQTISVQQKWEDGIRVSPLMRGGLAIGLDYVYDGRIYSLTERINVPWSDRQLNVELETMRDVTEPGAEENWRIKVVDNNGDPVVAEVMATMYDASLDAISPHNWTLALHPYLYLSLSTRSVGFSTATYYYFSHREVKVDRISPQRFADLEWQWHQNVFYGPRSGVSVRNFESSAPIALQDESPDQSRPAEKARVETMSADETTSSGDDTSISSPSIRENLDESVFFMPHLATSDEGDLNLKFKMNEALTRWKFMAIAHTSDLKAGQVAAEVVTQKELMIAPHVPRVLRQGDSIVLSARVTNMTDADMSVNVELSLVDVLSDSVCLEEFGVNSISQLTEVAAGETVVVKWPVEVPYERFAPIKYIMTADGGKHMDGEAGVLTIESSRTLVTETQFVYLGANESKRMDFSEIHRSSSPSFEMIGISLDGSGTPAWYVLQALPYLQAKSEVESSDAIFERIYANSIAREIIRAYPEVASVLESMDDQVETALSRNQDLKSAQIENTPWYRMMETEEDRLRRLKELLDPQKVNDELTAAINKLLNYQLSNGGWSWMPGGVDNRYMTQRVVTGFGHLQKLGIQIPEVMTPALRSAQAYLDSRMQEEYHRLVELASSKKVSLEDNHLSRSAIQYMYSRTFYSDWMSEGDQMAPILSYYEGQMVEYWTSFDLYSQALIGQVLLRSNTDLETVATIKKSFEERSLYEPTRGRFWKGQTGWYWYQAPVERHAMLMEFFGDVGVEVQFMDELKQYLLMLKQTTHWSTGRATSMAVYAMLMNGDSWLTGSQLQFEYSDPQPEEQNAVGSLYTRLTWPADDAVNLQTVEITNPNDHPAWAGTYVQYIEELDAVKADDDGELSITKTILRNAYNEGTQEVELAPGAVLKPGDNLIVRLTVRLDRDMDFVHIRDLRAIGLEPVNVLSGYRWKSGMGYYESTTDTSTDFFIDRLRRGTYVLEYPLRVAHEGKFSSGNATIQCHYAPEFAGHSGSVKLEVDSGF